MIVMMDGALQSIDRSMYESALLDGATTEAGVITENALPRELSVKAEGENDFLSLEAVEREHIAKVLTCFGNNRTLAASALGISRKTLYRKIREYDIM